MFAACSSEHPARRPEPLPKATKRAPSSTAAVIPPWQLWESAQTGPLAAADALDSEGKFDQSLRAYAEIEQRESEGRTKEEAFVRRVGTLLKLGQSRVALDQITLHLKNQGLGAQDISPILALLAAYSYEHQGDTNQTLAWLGVAYRKANGRGVVARRATTETESVLRRIPKEAFQEQNQIWTADNFFAPYFQREKARRSQGGVPESSSAALAWYRPESYGGSFDKGSIRESDLSPATVANVGPTGSGGTAVGVLLPLGGKYAGPAQQVREGIELAFNEAGISDRYRLVFADTGGDASRAESEYERLASQEGAAIVLGPLLVKEAEQVAQKSANVGVPFLTFTKRPGITALSRIGFRLGATAENQADELVTYAVRQLKLKSFALLYPDDGGSGSEFASAFRAAAAKSGGRISAEAKYTPGDQVSIAAAVSSVSAAPADAVFLPDSLEGASSVITALKSSPLKSATLLGPATWNDPVAVRGFGDLVEGAVYVTPYLASSAKPSVSTFNQHYRSAYHRDPDLLAAQAYDAASVVFRALQNGQKDQGDTKAVLIKNLKAADSFEGVTGKLAVTGDREITRRMSVVRLHHGETIEVMSGGTETGFVPDEPQENTAAKN
ncbi:MAG: penicillin-binding protein activator [Bdellovibrionota bacterium]